MPLSALADRQAAVATLLDDAAWVGTNLATPTSGPGAADNEGGIDGPRREGFGTSCILAEVSPRHPRAWQRLARSCHTALPGAVDMCGTSPTGCPSIINGQLPALQPQLVVAQEQKVLDHPELPSSLLMQSSQGPHPRDRAGESIESGGDVLCDRLEGRTGSLRIQLLRPVWVLAKHL